MISFLRNPSALVAALVLAILPHSACAITYADWIASYSLSGANALETADPDADGLPNLIEYALAGYNPTVSDISANTANYTQMGFCSRVGNNLNSYGAWQATKPSTGTVHAALRFKPRADATGIRYLVGIGHGGSGLFQWYSGRNAVYDQTLTGGYWQAVCKIPATRLTRIFMKLSVITDASVSAPLAGLNAAP